ncbi:MAG: class I SAM-dependent methyltransferase, partial [Bacteroidota bacterium]
MSNSKATQLLILTFIIITIGADTIAQNIYSQYTWEERDKWQQVPKILETMGVSEGDAIADIGCHEGYMTFKFVDRVGESGKVYAVDVNKSRLNALNDLLEEEDIENVVTIKGDYDNPNLEPESLDFAFIMDAYHEMEDYQDILRHIK